MPWATCRSRPKKKHPDAELSWIVNETLAPILDCAADVDHRLLFRRQRWGKVRHSLELWRFLRSLRRQSFDLVLDLQGLFRSGLCTWFAQAPRKIGFADAREGATLFYTENVSIPPTVEHAVDRNLLLASAALGEPCEYEAPRIAFPAASQEAGAAVRAEHDLTGQVPIMAVAPCSRWESKTWPPAFFAQTLDRIHDGSTTKPKIWLLGTAGERVVGDEIQAQMKTQVINLMGSTSLPVMMYLLAHSDLLLTNDSGPMHIAAALSVPTVALFGPTAPNKTGPYGPGHGIFQSQVACAPCFQRRCPLPEQICRTDLISPERISEYSIHRLTNPESPALENLS